MSTAPTATELRPTDSTPRAGISLTTRLAIELRKLVDTRAALVLLLVTAALTLFFTLVVPALLDETISPDKVAGELGAFPLIYLLPILGLITATSEWRHGTALWTYALDPKRSAVLSAKMVSILLVTAVAAALTLGLSYVGTALTGGDSAAGADVATLATRLLLGLGGFALVGFGLGSALLNAPLAICVYLIAPQVVPQLLALSETTARITPWMDIHHVLMGTLGGAPLGDTAPVVSSLVLWIVIPVAIGFWRNARRSA